MLHSAAARLSPLPWALHEPDLSRSMESSSDDVIHGRWATLGATASCFDVSSTQSARLRSPGRPMRTTGRQVGDDPIRRMRDRPRFIAVAGYRPGCCTVVLHLGFWTLKLCLTSEAAQMHVPGAGGCRGRVLVCRVAARACTSGRFRPPHACGARLERRPLRPLQRRAGPPPIELPP